MQKPPFVILGLLPGRNGRKHKQEDISVPCERKKILNAPIFRDIYALALTEELSCCTRSYIPYCDTLYWGELRYRQSCSRVRGGGGRGEVLTERVEKEETISVWL